MAPLAFDVMSAYSARHRGEAPDWSPLPVQYADFAIWQERALGRIDEADSTLAGQLEYWTRQLASVPELLALPADRPRPRVQDLSGGVVRFDIDAGIHRRLSETAIEHRSSMFMAVHAAYAVLVARLSGMEDITIGSPIAGRGNALLDPMVGMFVGTLVLRADVDPAASFTDLLARVRSTDLDAFAHADVPFERVVDALAPERSTSHSPLFQVMLEFKNNHSASSSSDGFGRRGPRTRIRRLEFRSATHACRDLRRRRPARPESRPGSPTPAPCSTSRPSKVSLDTWFGFSVLSPNHRTRRSATSIS